MGDRHLEYAIEVCNTTKDPGEVLVLDKNFSFLGHQIKITGTTVKRKEIRWHFM